MPEAEKMLEDTHNLRRVEAVEGPQYPLQFQYHW
jgi:hypothetical protein